MNIGGISRVFAQSAQIVSHQIVQAKKPLLSTISLAIIRPVHTIPL
jgi:hypothetical protein